MKSLPRIVKSATIISLIKLKPFQAIIGIISCFIPIIIILILHTVFYSMENETPKVDYEKVNKNGKSAAGIITDIETQNNVTINDKHPSIISYKYNIGGNEVSSKVKVLSTDKIEKLMVNDSIEVKHLEGESIIVGIQPFNFSFAVFYIIPGIFFIIGLPFILNLIYQVKKEVKLYKYGKVHEAVLISMTPKTAIMFPSTGIIVHYQYKTASGQKVLGKSITNDYSIINENRSGDLVKIFVSPENESKSCLVPRVEALRNNWKVEEEKENIA